MIRLLFVPVSGRQGAGEYFRSLALAQAAQRRWPEASIEFILNRELGHAADAPFPVHLIDGSPTHNTVAVNQVIDRMRPQVVIFDSAGRGAQLTHARSAGAATVFISSRFKTRWKGFRLRRMRALDQHWLAWPLRLQGRLTWHERVKLRLIGTVRIVPVEVIYAPPRPQCAARLQRELGVTAGGYVLVCGGGGGGYQRRGRPAHEVFAEAAALLGRALDDRPGPTVICVGGSGAASASAGPERVLQLAALDGEAMIDLLSGARLAIVNGGSLLLQTLSLQIPCVAAPVAGDQEGRIALCAKHGLVARAQLDGPRMAAAAARLLTDERQYLDMLRAQQAFKLENGIDRAVDALASLLEERGQG